MTEPCIPKPQPERVFRWQAVFLLAVAAYALGAVMVKWADLHQLETCFTALRYLTKNCVCLAANSTLTLP